MSRSSSSFADHAGAKPLSRPLAYAAVVFAIMFWAGNIVMGRGLYVEVPPLAIAFWRWAAAAIILLPFSWPHLKARRERLRGTWWRYAVKGFFIVIGGNLVLYVAVSYTTAINATIVNAAQPLVTIVLARPLLGERISPVQGAGIMLGLVGVLVVVLRGDLAALLALEINPGDLLMVVAVACWSGYAVLVKRWPTTLHPLADLQLVMTFGAAMAAPFYLWDLAQGRTMAVGFTSLGFILYSAVLASIVAIALWNQGIRALGAGRAGAFVYLMPVWGTLFAVLFLSERLSAYHLLGFAGVLAGIVLMSREIRGS